MNVCKNNTFDVNGLIVPNSKINRSGIVKSEIPQNALSLSKKCHDDYSRLLTILGANCLQKLSNKSWRQEVFDKILSYNNDRALLGVINRFDLGRSKSAETALEIVEKAINLYEKSAHLHRYGVAGAGLW